MPFSSKSARDCHFEEFIPDPYEDTKVWKFGLTTNFPQARAIESGIFQNTSEDFTCKVAETPDQAKQLIEAGFE